jgi:hypothetical protein
MTHDEYLSRLETWSDDDATAVLAHAESCAACRRDRRSAERALSRLEGTPARGSRFEEAAGVAAVAAMVAIAIGGLTSWSGRSTTPVSPIAARYRIVGGPAGVVAYTPTETIVASGGGARTPTDEKETHR